MPVLKENKFRVLVLAVIFAAFFSLGFTGISKISPKLQQKLYNAVQTAFEVEGFELKPLDLNLGEDSLFKIGLESEVLGYAYLGKAPSMKDVFDYVVLFNPELDVKKAKVLIYRENHGRQIGSQRWLKQFIGKKPGDSMEYGNDVDAISGATISAKSMTQAVSKVLSQMKELKEKGSL